MALCYLYGNMRFVKILTIYNYFNRFKNKKQISIVEIIYFLIFICQNKILGRYHGKKR